MPMPEKPDQLPDTADDEIGLLLDAVQSITQTTAIKRHLIEKAVKAMASAGYVTIHGTHKSYNISRIGQSYQYDVPIDKRGALAPFRGKRVRIVCAGNYGFNGKIIMAGHIK